MLSLGALARPSRLVRSRPVVASASFGSTPCLGPRSWPLRPSHARRRLAGVANKEERKPSSSSVSQPQPFRDAGHVRPDSSISRPAPSPKGAVSPGTETAPNSGGQQDDGLQHASQDPPNSSLKSAAAALPRDQSPPNPTESQDKLFDTPSPVPAQEDMRSLVPMARRFLEYQKSAMIPTWAVAGMQDLLMKASEDSLSELSRKHRQRKSSPLFPPLYLPESFERENLVHVFQLVPRILEPLCRGEREPAMPPAEVEAIRSSLESTLEWIARHNFKNLVPDGLQDPHMGKASPEHPGLLNDRWLDQFLRWSRFHHALSYFHLVITECNLKYDDHWSKKCWEKHLPGLEALSMNREARLAAQVLLCEPRPDIDIQGDFERYLFEGEAAAIPPPGIDQALYTHVQDTVLGHLQLGPPPTKDFETPCTIINVSFPGIEGPKDILQASHISRELMQYIASTANANLIFLDSRSLAYIIGPYLGQENTWASGPYSQLAYTTAAISGRVLDMVPEPLEDDGSFPAFLMRASSPWLLKRMRRVPVVKRFPGASSDQGQSSKWSEKPKMDDETSKWIILKAQAALESILSAVDFSTSNSLIVHLDEMVELSMVAECRFLGWKLENAINKLRAKGKKVILVGTATQARAQGPLAMRLQALSQTNTVVALPIDPKVWEATRRKKLVETQQCINLDHNIANLVHVLQHMIPRDRGVDLSARKFDVNLIRTLHGNSLLLGVLSQQSVFHLATVMVRHANDGRPVGEDALFRALESFYQADAARSRYQDVTKSLSSPLAAPPELDEDAAVAKLRVGTENEYEEKLVTGIVRPKDINTTFADVHVPKEITEALKTFTSLSLERPDAFSYGILATDKISGCLLYGPPGTGKTLLAKAVAKDSKASVLEVSGASIRDMWAGNSEKNVRAIFTLARKIEPCVIFLDEADAILGHRSGESNSSSTIHRDIINQFLREWDGVTGSKAFVMIATNRPFDLDDAVLRRVPRRILIDLPLQADREAILKILLKNEQLGEDVSLAGIAKATPFYSGSDLKNVCVTAAMGAVKDEMAQKEGHQGPEPYVFPEKRTIYQRHFDSALKEISSSISEDMDTLTAIRKFDQQYGSGRKTNKRARGMGFEVVPPAKDAEEVLVRKGIALPA